LKNEIKDDPVVKNILINLTFLLSGDFY